MICSAEVENVWCQSNSIYSLFLQIRLRSKFACRINRGIFILTVKTDEMQWIHFYFVFYSLSFSGPETTTHLKCKWHTWRVSAEQWMQSTFTSCHRCVLTALARPPFFFCLYFCIACMAIEYNCVSAYLGIRAYIHVLTQTKEISFVRVSDGWDFRVPIRLCCMETATFFIWCPNQTTIDSPTK